MRLYSSPVHVDIVRMIGYDDWVLYDARCQIVKLMRRHGVASVISAAAELIEVDHRPGDDIARLSGEVRCFAIGILGRPVDEKASATKSAIPLRREPKVAIALPTEEETATDFRLVNARRIEVVKRYAKHLGVHLMTHEVAAKASLPLDSPPLPATIDFIVHRHDEHHLIAVRKH